MTVKLSFGWIYFNSELVSWPNTVRIMQTLYECISASVVILSMKTKLIQRAEVVEVKFLVIFFSPQDRQTVDLCNPTKFKTTFVGEHTTYLALNEWVNTIVVILPNAK